MTGVPSMLAGGRTWIAQRAGVALAKRAAGRLAIGTLVGQALPGSFALLVIDAVLLLAALCRSPPFVGGKETFIQFALRILISPVLVRLLRGNRRERTGMPRDTIGPGPLVGAGRVALLGHVSCGTQSSCGRISGVVDRSRAHPVSLFGGAIHAVDHRRCQAAFEWLRLTGPIGIGAGNHDRPIATGNRDQLLGIRFPALDIQHTVTDVLKVDE